MRIKFTNPSGIHCFEMNSPPSNTAMTLSTVMSVWKKLDLKPSVIMAFVYLLRRNGFEKIIITLRALTCRHDEYRTFFQ